MVLGCTLPYAYRPAPARKQLALLSDAGPAVQEDGPGRTEDCEISDQPWWGRTRMGAGSSGPLLSATNAPCYAMKKSGFATRFDGALRISADHRRVVARRCGRETRDRRGQARVPEAVNHVWREQFMNLAKDSPLIKTVVPAWHQCGVHEL